jgi:hypothetical protein
MWLGSAGETPSHRNDGECVIEPAANGTVAEASGHVSGLSSHAGKAEALLHDLGGSSTAPDATDGIDYSCPLDRKTKKLGGARAGAGSVTLAQYLDYHVARGTKEVKVFVCAPDTERTTNGEPLPFNSNYLGACIVCGLGALFVLVCSS